MSHRCMSMCHDRLHSAYSVPVLRFIFEILPRCCCLLDRFTFAFPKLRALKFCF